MKYFLLLLGLTPTFAAAAAAGGSVILVRGTAKLDNGKVLALKDEVPAGATVKTEAKSFVKLLFADQTQLNVGPDTTMKIEATRPGEPGLVNLVGGQLRAKVTKDLLQGGEKPSEKMVVKTKTAAMGIRGTDFNVSFNEQNQITALITFEGNVAMVKNEGSDPVAALAAGDQVQSVGPGQFSGAQPDMAQASVPIKISPAQLETLRANDSFRGVGEKAETRADALASPIPPGVDPKNFSSAPPTPSTTAASGGPPPEGFFDAKSGAYAPRAGGFLDLNTGRYVPPPPGSSYDPNTGVFVPPSAVGQFDPATGMYVPPKGVELDPVKGFVADNRGGALPPSQAQNLAAALNFSARPENAGKQVSFMNMFGPGMAGLPPPSPPPPQGMLPPPPREPTDDPHCPTCIRDNIQQNPVNTNIRFNIVVQ